MKQNLLHVWQERVFDMVTYLTYFLMIISFFGISVFAPSFVQSFDYYVKIYICLFLLWRFNGFRTQYEFTELDRKISFAAGLFILTTTILNTYVNEIKQKTRDIVSAIL